VVENAGCVGQKTARNIRRITIMSLQLCVLASGSSGNCTYVGTDRTGILIDAGLSGKETQRRLEQLGLGMANIQAVCVSHEHGDHTAGLRVLNRRHGIPLFVNSATRDILCRAEGAGELSWNIFQSGSAFPVGDLVLEPFTVPHDAADPVGFIVKAGALRVGITTDIGMITERVVDALSGCHALVIEANHDEHLLENAERPWSLKRRIKGRLGHLSNEHAAEMVARVAGPHLQHVFLAHLSADCNRGELALQTAVRTLKTAGHHHVRVSLTFPDRISDVWRG